MIVPVIFPEIPTHSLKKTTQVYTTLFSGESFVVSTAHVYGVPVTRVLSFAIFLIFFPKHKTGLVHLLVEQTLHKCGWNQE